MSVAASHRQRHVATPTHNSKLPHGQPSGIILAHLPVFWYPRWRNQRGDSTVWLRFKYGAKGHVRKSMHEHQFPTAGIWMYLCIIHMYRLASSARTSLRVEAGTVFNRQSHRRSICNMSIAWSS